MKIKVKRALTELFPPQLANKLVGCVLTPVGEDDEESREPPEVFEVYAGSVLAAVQERHGGNTYDDVSKFFTSLFGVNWIDMSITFPVPSTHCVILTS